MLVGTSATSLMLTGATLRDEFQGPPPPTLRHPIIHHFVRAGLCRAQIKHNDQFRRELTNWRVLGSAQPRIPWDAN